MKGTHGDDIADEEERQDDPGRRPRAEEEGEDEDVEHPDSREPGFPDAHTQGSHGRENPFADRHEGSRSNRSERHDYNPTKESASRYLRVRFVLTVTVFTVARRKTTVGPPSRMTSPG